MSSSSRGGRHYADSALRESGGEASSSQGSHSGNGSGLGSASTGDGYHNNSSANRKSLSRHQQYTTTTSSSTSTTYLQQTNTGLFRYRGWWAINLFGLWLLSKYILFTNFI